MTMVNGRRGVVVQTKSKKIRAPNLDDESIGRIVEILDGWSSPKLTWNLFIEQIFLRLRVRYTRQALNNYSRIKESFSACKKAVVSVESMGVKAVTSDQLRILRLEAEIERLKIENNALLEQFNRWVYNGYQKGMDDKMRDFMNQPLIEVQREPSVIMSNARCRKVRK